MARRKLEKKNPKKQKKQNGPLEKATHTLHRVGHVSPWSHWLLGNMVHVVMTVA